MTGMQLVGVLVGLAALIAVIAVLARARAARTQRSDALASQPARSSRPSHLTTATASAAATTSAAAVIPAARAEAAQLRDARLAAQQALQALAFSTPLVPAPASARDGVRQAASTSASASPEDPEHAAAAGAIRQTLLEIVDRPTYAPRRPLLLPKLMQAMNDNDTSRRELARIIATDPALAGGLLRLANSPFYRLQAEPVESLDRAIALLGLEGMRSLIAAALLQPVFRISGGLFLQFGEITWEHTLYAASAAEAHAAVLENADPFAAQLLALIMGLASIVVFRVATDEFLGRKLRPNAATLAGIIDLESPAVGRRIAASWELSERMDSALAEQLAADVPASALGRSLQLGRFIGALTLLHAHGAMDEQQVLTALKTGGPRAEAYVRIWSRLASSRAVAG